jgi:hypothetical protein
LNDGFVVATKVQSKVWSVYKARRN